MASNPIDLKKRYTHILAAVNQKNSQSLNLRQFVGLILGPLFFILFHFLVTPVGMTNEARSVLGITLWIATWWITEPIPIPATSLLPLILFPLTQSVDSQTVSSAYGDSTIFLFLGGFLIAIAMEKWSLHKRVALTILSAVGTSAKWIIFGFMLSTGFLSMWISNTAATMMMVPIGVAIISQVKEVFAKENCKDLENFKKAMLLGIAYSASIGGLGTLIGTPPNLILAGVVREVYGFEISFARWMLFATPIALIMLIIVWLYLLTIVFPIKMKEIPNGQEIIKREKKSLGRIGFEEKMVLAVFIFAATSWIMRPIINKLLPGINDTSIALIAALLLFLIPSVNKKGERILGWDSVKQLPWGILLLFGGGLAIAGGFMSSGLASWIITQLNVLVGIDLIIVLFSLALLVKFLTEITSNTATATMLLPIMASLAFAIDVHPFSLMIVATVTAALAFMMPVGTPPNAIVFGTNYLTIGDMVKAGLMINLISIIIVVLAVYYFVPLIWGIDLNVFPEVFK